MKRLNNPAAFLSGLVLNTAKAHAAAVRQTIAPLGCVDDDMAKRLQKDHRLTGKRVGGHLCIIATPKG